MFKWGSHYDWATISNSPAVDPGTQDRDPDSKVHGANMGPIWGRQDPGGPHVGPMNLSGDASPIDVTVVKRWEPTDGGL